MKMKSISGVVFYVKNLQKTLEFYQALGFEITKNEPTHLSVRLNWFWVDFHPFTESGAPDFQHLSKLENDNAGFFLYISVDDVDEFYNGLTSKGLKPDSKPQDYPWGNREFIIKDPDNYKLVFFKKK